MTRDNQRVTEYLLAENAVLREQLRGRHIIYTDAQRRRLATAAKKLGRKALKQLDTLVTPDTLLPSRGGMSADPRAAQHGVVVAWARALALRLLTGGRKFFNKNSCLHYDL
jgi:hypothetical protein